ncbi:O-antigen ligase family protein [Gorillibacterium timonense]|uniref:O-antigen ligase family protein n=1 Tax=Gorillibacterium timonense TaxID=1689269 RepID=UPI00071E256C|nr:O-antigen ligase family protein [Gorillibacterium timonense]
MKNNRPATKYGFIDILSYFILIPFLYPRGFAEISTTYKLFFTIWLWAAVAIIWIQYLLYANIMRSKINRRGFALTLYFVLSILLTIIIRGNLSSGLQQMLAAPSLCVFIIYNFDKYWHKILGALLNIFIMLLFLNGVVFKGYFVEYTHVIFLGHVQVVSQIGMVAIFVALLNYMLIKRRKFKSVLLLIMSILTMFSTDATSAVLVSIILIVIGIVYKWRLYHIFCLKSKWYVVFGFLMSISVIYIATVNNNYSVFISDPTFSGRRFVWLNAISHITSRPIFGFGIDGVLITTFWTQWSGGGFNYAHNQIIQNLLDGGIVLCAAFWTMMFTYASYIDNLKHLRYKVLSNAILIVLLIVMIFDSTTLYCYMFIFLAILVKLPNIENDRS